MLPVLVAIVLVVAGCSNRTPAVPRQPTPAPAAGTPLPTIDGTDRERREGNWNLVHRVDVPKGWTLSGVQVDGPHELSGWRRVGDEANSYCGVSVWKVGPDFSPQPSGGEPVDVGGRPGLFLGKGDSYESLTGLWWNYRPEAWASLDCGDDLGRDDYLALAARVTFTPTKVLLPFRLRSVPKGYRVDYLGWDQVTGPRSFELAVRSLGEDEFPLPPRVIMSPTTTASPAPTGGERLTLGGRPALFDLKARTLCFPLSGWQACVEGGSDSNPPEPDGDARLRERLLAVATELDFASNLDDPGTWFDGNTAAAAR